MKEFPRIYSLSTIGLIHHKEFDYKFHPFRTDFNGDSGVGKSMIADLIQLILVGADVFYSPTKAMDEREPEGMVLKVNNQGKEFGYAFLNLEMRPDRYLIIGCYIEAGSRSTQAFIIQAGYDWQNPAYLLNPLGFNQLLKGDEIQSPEALVTFLEDRGLHGKFWHRIKGYHEILYREKIVPLDLHVSDRALKDYAQILQSFARGQSLDTRKSDSLKHFLFGSQERNEIMDSYRKVLKDMETSVGEYGSNQREIERVTQKQEALLELKKKKTVAEGTREIWLTRNLIFCNQEVDRFDNELLENIKEYVVARQHAQLLKELLQTETTLIEQLLPELVRQRDVARRKFTELDGPYRRIQVVEDWLGQLSCTFPELSGYFGVNRQRKLAKDGLTRFLSGLRAKRLEMIFAEIPDKSNFRSLNQYLVEGTAELGEKIKEKEILQKYANIRDPDSLANWAISQNRVFTREEESAILKYQELPRRKSNNDDYLPHPAELILSLNIEGKDEKGFWINLQGIRTYIDYVIEPILNTADRRRIESYFEAYTSTLGEDISKLKQRLSLYKELEELVHALPRPAEILAAYANKEELLQYREISFLNISEELFQEHLDAYGRRDEIIERYTRSKEEDDIANEALTEASNRRRNYQTILKKVNLADPHPQTMHILGQYPVDSYIGPYALMKENVRGELTRAQDKQVFFEDGLESARQKMIKLGQLPEQKRLLDQARTAFASARSNYLEWHDTLPVDLAVVDYVTAPKEEYDAYIDAEKEYTHFYGMVIDTYIDSKEYLLADQSDFSTLAKNLLPEAFHDAVLGEGADADVIETIANYLKRINEKNRQLNNRKIQRIKDLLDEVDVVITSHENTVRRIDNFLKGGNSITGGYKARLRRTASVNYPREWMQFFREQLEDSIETVNSLQQKLAEKIDIEEMMKTAFVHCGGSGFVNASADKLLSPGSYYDLSFAMESDSGGINTGSTGQTYAAIALLCIARLSIATSEEGKTTEPAVRFIPIDEAEGLGSNYDLLYEIARKFDYQLLSMSISPMSQFKEGEQYVYILHRNPETEIKVNYTPLAILCEEDKTKSAYFV